ncbi:uncharacterized protein [Drosophila virilis]|uniref:Uncharacterized protein, isoform C n=1 Tax=Drosophila virilis TaxID=7244 RepID=A0A0Q9WJG8_DROVI|nr:uncharacterized protein LOC26531569 isoform X2 [Drosophila virilis]KRF84776.1 uncharacterized protein Dvir_GJ26799, isoform C [Drosophila virilis]
MEDQQSENIPIDDECDSPIGISLLQICYFIALFDFAQSIYFLAQSTSLLVLNVNLYTMVAFAGSIFWILMVILLIVGLWKRRLRLIICWLIFSIIGIIVDIFFFVWTISISEYVQWPQIIQFTLLYLVVEWLCIYIVYRYCLNIVMLSTDREKQDQPNTDHPIELAPSNHQKASSANSRTQKPKKKRAKTIIVKNSSNRSRGFELLKHNDKTDETNFDTPQTLRDSLEKESYKDKRIRH